MKANLDHFNSIMGRVWETMLLDTMKTTQLEVPSDEKPVALDNLKVHTVCETLMVEFVWSTMWPMDTDSVPTCNPTNPVWETKIQPPC